MVGRNTNIYFPEEVYNKLRQVVGEKISRFVSEAVEEKLQKTELKKQEELKKKLMAGYQAVASNQKIQKELEVWEETVSDMWRKEKK